MGKRKTTKKQLEALAKGREKQLQNQLRKKSRNPNYKRRPIIRERTNSTNTNHSAVQNQNMKVDFSLFNKLLSIKFFPIEINRAKEKLNFKEVINHIFSKLDYHSKKIHANNSEITEIINYLNRREEKYNQQFTKLRKQIMELKEENEQLKEHMKVLNDNESKDKIQKN
ncbi:hypothetical protein [Methanohalophilus sp. WG1-DM]|uniref:hypothetical protein n=1 Tax=Methanohalophilus sp. WG1-DM TaxID=2491675 RepID=UPI000FFECE4F|nr:hypothetical protein [Methanohalophilus sp. WG1-DM]RXG35033.1 hypothetical protein CI957_57 [Methanohalophilus sp. WG1-DM]